MSDHKIGPELTRQPRSVFVDLMYQEVDFICLFFVNQTSAQQMPHKKKKQIFHITNKNVHYNITRNTIMVYILFVSPV